MSPATEVATMFQSFSLDRYRPAALTLGLALLPTLGAAPAAGQMDIPARFTTAEGASAVAEANLDRGRYSVLIDLDENRLFFRQGELVLWSAPIGTGMGLRMQDGDREWDFSTPRGTFQVKYKELDPTWIAPDWFYVNNGLPVPPPNDPKRYMPGRLGAAAVYINEDLAIHGTDRPELLGQRVSHGCIRLENKYALRLYHNVQPGTEVVIVGGEDLEQRTISAREMQARLAANFRPAATPPRDPELERWKDRPTSQLLVELNRQLALDEEESRWADVTRLLVARAVEDGDFGAARSLFLAMNELTDERIEREFGTFLSDMYRRAPMRTLEALARMLPRERQRAADAIVAASLAQYPGDLSAPSAPWPTRRVPESLVEREGRRGWSALAEAERPYRSLSERTGL